MTVDGFLCSYLDDTSVYFASKRTISSSACLRGECPGYIHCCLRYERKLGIAHDGENTHRKGIQLQVHYAECTDLKLG